MLIIPECIKSANVATFDAHHEWDEWNVRDYFMFQEADQFASLEKLTPKANLALAIACGEWISFRFLPLEGDSRPLQYLEAAWAAVVDPAYCIYTSIDEDEWRGPVRGPLAITMAVVNDAIFRQDDAPAAQEACWMYNLAVSVLPSVDAFDIWFDVAVSRLGIFHTTDIDVNIDEDIFALTDWQGSPIPRQALDPDFSYDPRQAPTLIDAFLRQLLPDQNPYLRSADEIKQAGGVNQIPYQYQPP